MESRDGSCKKDTASNIHFSISPTNSDQFWEVGTDKVSIYPCRCAMYPEVLFRCRLKTACKSYRTIAGLPHYDLSKNDTDLLLAEPCIHGS